MDIEFDFKGDPVGGIVSKCKFEFVYLVHFAQYLFFALHSYTCPAKFCTCKFKRSARKGKTGHVNKVMPDSS